MEGCLIGSSCLAIQNVVGTRSHVCILTRFSAQYRSEH